MPCEGALANSPKAVIITRNILSPSLNQMTELEAGDTEAQTRNVSPGSQASSLALPLPQLAGLGKAILSLQASVFPAVKWENDIHLCQTNQ